MFKKRFFMATAFALLFSLFLSSCVGGGVQQPTDTSVISDTEPTSTVPVTDEVTTTATTEPDPAVTDVTTDAPVTEPPATEPVTEPVTDPVVVPAEPVDIKTTGGVVIVGIIGVDDNGWHIKPEQPLNISFEYFLGKPSVFNEQRRIAMFDPKVDGVEKALYLGQTVTVAGSFRFYRDDFSTLYFTPYTITIGKTVAESYGDSTLKVQDEPKNLYDPSVPLPEQMNPVTKNGRYVYNPYMLSEETLQLMGNDFANFYVGFVDAFLNYKPEFDCPDKNYAEMLSTVIYYEFPLYNACAEPFSFVLQYNAEKGTASIKYLYDKETHRSVVDKLYAAANTMLANTSPDFSDEENAKIIYHALSSRMTYDHSALTDFERKESYYAYLNNSGVCVTFANVYNQLLTCVGIKTTLAHCDNTDTVGHSWSIVTIGDKQYFCDPTYELSYDKGTGYRFFGMNYADRTADGLGAQGIRYGRYYVLPLDASMIAETSLVK